MDKKLHLKIEFKRTGALLFLHLLLLIFLLEKRDTS